MTYTPATLSAQYIKKNAVICSRILTNTHTNMNIKNEKKVTALFLNMVCADKHNDTLLSLHSNKQSANKAIRAATDELMDLGYQIIHCYGDPNGYYDMITLSLKENDLIIQATLLCAQKTIL